MKRSLFVLKSENWSTTKSNEQLLLLFERKDLRMEDRDIDGTSNWSMNMGDANRVTVMMGRLSRMYKPRPSPRPSYPVVGWPRTRLIDGIQADLRALGISPNISKTVEQDFLQVRAKLWLLLW